MNPPKGTDEMAWKITHDYINGGEGDSVPSRVGTRSTGPELEGPTFRFRILDDDGEVYYGGVADAHAATADDGEPGSLYEALQWGEYDAGATDLQMRPSDALEYHLASPAMTEPLIGSANPWVSIYG
jgi:hypothetical protein